MSGSRTAEDFLRAEYVQLLPRMRRTQLALETEIRREVLPIALTGTARADHCPFAIEGFRECGGRSPAAAGASPVRGGRCGSLHTLFATRSRRGPRLGISPTRSESRPCASADEAHRLARGSRRRLCPPDRCVQVSRPVESAGRGRCRNPGRVHAGRPFLGRRALRHLQDDATNSGDRRLGCDARRVRRSAAGTEPFRNGIRPAYRSGSVIPAPTSERLSPRSTAPRTARSPCPN